MQIISIRYTRVDFTFGDFIFHFIFTFGLLPANLIKYFQVLNYVEIHGKNLLNPLKYNLINTTFNVIQMVIDEAIDVNPDDYQKFLISWIQAATMFGIAWGIGGILNEESRKEFDHFHRKVYFNNHSIILEYKFYQLKKIA